MARSRLVIIGFHGGGPYYTEPLVARGRMPNWQRLAQQGVTAQVRSTWPVAAGAWVTLLTGLDVAQHGVLDVCEIDARRFPSMATQPIDARRYAAETWLSMVSLAGCSVAAISVPMAAPPWPINGVLVPGVPVSDEVHPPTWPPELRDRIGPISLCRYDEVDVRDLQACRRYLDFDLERMVDIGSTIYRDRAWDVFLLVFKVPDLANHLFCQNPAVPDWRAMIDEYLERTDAALGEIVSITDPDSVVMVLSDHGSRPMPPWVFSVTSWLEAEGWLARSNGALASASGLGLAHRAYRTLLASPLAQRVKTHVPSAIADRVRSIGHHWSFVDLARTRVYPVDLFYPLAGFEVNLRGREERGIVSRAEYEALRASLMERLARLRTPHTDSPLCRGVHLREELFDGPFMDRFPDVIAELHPDLEADLHFAPEILAPNAGKASYPYRGYHGSEGLLLMSGPGIPVGASVAGAHIHDFMPTVMRLLDLPVPPNRIGRFLPDRLRA